MAVENDPSARPLVRLLPLLGPAAGIAVALSLVVLALWRFAPGLLPALALLLAWGAALLWGMALAARRQGRESEEARRRLEEDLARAARETDSLRQEVDGYRGLFESRPAERKAPAVPVPAPAPANVHNFIRDPLTGLFHRRYFEASVEREIHRMERRNLPLGIILMRLDARRGLRGAPAGDRRPPEPPRAGRRRGQPSRRRDLRPDPARGAARRGADARRADPQRRPGDRRSTSLARRRRLPRLRALLREAAAGGQGPPWTRPGRQAATAWPWRPARSSTAA